MVSILKVDKIQKPNSDSDMVSLNDTGVNFTHTPTIGGVELISSMSGQIVQMEANTFVSRDAHIQTTSTTMTTTGASVSITPKYTDSTIFVSAMSGMGYGRSGASLTWGLYRSGAGVTDGFIINKTASYATDYYHGWIYVSASEWQTLYGEHLDTTYNTTQQLTYTLYHSQWTAGSASYTAHQGHQVTMKAIEIKA